MRILIGYNGTEYSKAALDDLRNAGLPKNGVEAVVLTVVELCLPPSTESEAKSFAASAANRISSDFPDWKVTPAISTGAPAREILARADVFRPDLIIVGEPRQTVADGNIFLGHTTKTIISEAECSVRVSRGQIGQKSHSGRLVVGFDGSAASELSAEAVASRQWPAGTNVQLLAVADAFLLGSIGRFAPQITDAVLETKFASQWAETLAADSVERLTDAGLNASVSVRTGRPGRTLVEAAEEQKADCIFVGPHNAPNSFARFIIGSVSASVAARAHCSVEIVRADNH